MSISTEDKTALTELNNRFLNYVNRVRQLKDEEDIKVINQSINLLEEELKSLKCSYESQISQLRTTLDIILKEKLELEKESLSRKNNENHLNDRLTVENSKNSKLLHEMGCLRSDLSSREQEIITINMNIKQLRLENGDLRDKCGKMCEILQENRGKSDSYETQIRDLENQISSLNEKLGFQDNFFMRKSEEMRCKMGDYMEKMVEMDYKVGETKEKEREWQDVLGRVQKTAEEQYGRLKLELGEYYNEKISHLQKQLDTSNAENEDLKFQNQLLNNQVLLLRKQESEMMSQIEDFGRKNQLLDDTIKSDKINSEKVITSLQSKIKELQDHFINELEQAKLDKSTKVNLRAEIEFLRRLLSEEEHRLNIRINQEAFSCHEDGGSEEIIETIERVSEEESSSHERQRVLNKGDAEQVEQEEYTVYEEEEMTKDTKGTTLKNEDGELVGHSILTDVTASLRQPLPNIRSNIVGPIVNDVHTTNQRPPRVVSAHNNHHNMVEETSVKCNARSTTADSGIGQSPDYMDTVFRQNDLTQSPDQGNSSISLTALKVLEVNKDGKFVKIWNSNENQDAEIGACMIKQNRFGHPVAMFRFPDRVKIPSNGTVNVWAGSNDPLLHQPPTDFYSNDPPLWGATPEYTTILCTPSGQAISWTTPSHRINPDPFRAKTAPSYRKDSLLANHTGSTQKRFQEQKLPELIPISNSTEPLYLIQHDTPSLSPASVGPQFHPFTSTPKAPIHPCYESVSRGKVLANDNSSLNRQTRQLTDGVPDMMIGHPYAGTNQQKMIGSARVMKYYPPIIQKSHSFNNKPSEIFFRSNTEPPNVFQKPMGRFAAGLDQVQSMHNHNYSGPMYRPSLAET